MFAVMWGFDPIFLGWLVAALLLAAWDARRKQ